MKHLITTHRKKVLGKRKDSQQTTVRSLMINVLTLVARTCDVTVVKG
jgi:hypothetical protein